MAPTLKQASAIPTPRAILAPRAKWSSGRGGEPGIAVEETPIAMTVALGPMVAGRRWSGSRSLGKMKNLELSTLQSPEPA